MSRVQMLPLMRAMPEDHVRRVDMTRSFCYLKRRNLFASQTTQNKKVKKWSYFMYNNIIQGNFAVIFFPLFHLLVRQKAFSVGQHMVPSARLFLRVRPS